MEEQNKTRKLKGKKAILQKLVDEGKKETSWHFAKRSIILSSIILVCLLLAFSMVVYITKAYEGLEVAVMLIVFLPFIVGAFLCIDLILAICSAVNIKYQFKLNRKWQAWFALALLVISQLAIVVCGIIVYI